ncbi:MAG TPA: PASTA domain-containing protein [Vicinamibacteria bacterium]|nr:PASTA domain-containing protein [Vicinamibacteria bacterium]
MGVGALALAAASLAATPAVAAVGQDGTRAYAMAREADDAAAEAQAEGEAVLKQFTALTGAARDREAVRPFQEAAEAGARALGGYRKLAQASADEAFKLLAEAGRAPESDAIRREVIEQKALLAAHEAAVMAARARAEAERLRAVAAEARAQLATAPPPPPPARPAPGREVEVPNLIGLRLADVARDLAALGLRLGATTGPRDGFVVKQAPAPGARVARQAAVSVTLSATAAGVVPVPAR